MQSIELIRENLARSQDLVLRRVEEMRDHCRVPPTPRGGAHTLWVLGHLAYIEGLIVQEIMLGEPNPLESWRERFDGAEIGGEAGGLPPFDEVLQACRRARVGTIALVDTLSEDDLDRTSARVPAGAEELFGTHRRCLQYASDHWLMHRGQLADARRAAGVERMWY